MRSAALWAPVPRLPRARPSHGCPVGACPTLTEPRRPTPVPPLVGTGAGRRSRVDPQSDRPWASGGGSVRIEWVRTEWVSIEAEWKVTENMRRHEWSLRPLGWWPVRATRESCALAS
ncbi:hypothetical protein GCM10022233_40920 [Streptomyces shaanxiensis]|uniref:Uncharacterized protein n=1 Tax=Streptomyces shaanxiensis TaxID=653357 RepID=A0ABP7VAJ6_9ACTN